MPKKNDAGPHVIAYVYAKPKGGLRCAIGALPVPAGEDAHAVASRVASRTLGDWFESVEVMVSKTPVSGR